MPHKRNPVTCAAILAAATRAPGLVATMMAAQAQEQERSLGNWHAEWVVLPELTMLGGGALHLSVGLIEGLEVDARRMRANLELTQGLIMAEALSMALAAKLGKEEAHRLVEELSRRAARKKRHLRDVAAALDRIVPGIRAAQLKRLFDPGNYTGQANTLVERVLRTRR